MAGTKSSRRILDVAIGNARLAFRNFSGKEGRFNPEGRRNFCIFLEPEIASDMKDAGWNIKFLQPKDPDDEPQAYIQVGVNFSNYPPKIVAITSNSRSYLDETNVTLLDWADIVSSDAILRPYLWEVNGKTGVKAYLKVLYVTIREDVFAEKYKNVPDSAIAAELDDEPPF